MKANIKDRIRGSIDIPLTDDGVREAIRIGRFFKASGGVDAIYSSKMERAIETAKLIGYIVGIPAVQTTSKLNPWYLGELEGQPTKQVLEKIRFYIEHPDEIVPGRAKGSTQAGESFSSFKNRFLNFIHSLVVRATDEKIVAVTHFRGLKVVDAWVRKGTPSSLNIDVPAMVVDGMEPGSIMQISNTNGHWSTKLLNHEKPRKLTPGVYLVRHGYTKYNAPQAAHAPHTS